MERVFYTSFESLADALEYRNRIGGWVFAPDTGTEFIVFHPAFNRTMILNHRVTRGLSGLIGCTAEQLSNPGNHWKSERVFPVNA